MAKRKSKNVQSKPNISKHNISSALVDIIIPVHQRFDLLGQCIEAFPDATDGTNYNVVIVDNGSPKETADEFYSQYPDIKVIRNKENVGFPKSCNQGFDRSFSPFVFFLNSDVILKPKSIAYLIDEMRADPKVGVAGMKLIFPEQTDLPQNNGNRPAGKLQHIGLATNIRAEFVHMFIGWSPDHPKVNAMRDVYAVTGAAMMTRRNIFAKAGKFNEIYGRGTYEDVDFCLTARELGYNIIVVPKAEGIHHTGATAVTYNLGYPLNENRMIFLQRWQNKLDWTEINHW